MDRDSKFSTAFRTLLQEAGVEPVVLPARSPNLNAHLERFHRSVKSECLERIASDAATLADARQLRSSMPYAGLDDASLEVLVYLNNRRALHDTDLFFAGFGE
jgi:transposase InsO family protein